jgi:hypothetical protein
MIQKRLIYTIDMRKTSKQMSLQTWSGDGRVLNSITGRRKKFRTYGSLRDERCFKI